MILNLRLDFGLGAKGSKPGVARGQAECGDVACVQSDGLLELPPVPEQFDLLGCGFGAGAPADRILLGAGPVLWREESDSPLLNIIRIGDEE
jgi:hypothetical protein